MAPSLCTDWLLATSCQLHCRVWDVPFPNVCICLVACHLSLLPQSQDLVMNVDVHPLQRDWHHAERELYAILFPFLCLSLRVNCSMAKLSQVACKSIDRPVWLLSQTRQLPLLNADLLGKLCRQSLLQTQVTARVGPSMRLTCG